MSGRLPTAQHLQVMSPRRLANANGNNEEEASNGDVAMSVPVPGADLVAHLQQQLTAQATSSNVPPQNETPVKRLLREELSEVVDAHVQIMQNEEQAVQEKDRETASKLQRVLADQRHQFKDAAKRYDEMRSANCNVYEHSELRCRVYECAACGRELWDHYTETEKWPWPNFKKVCAQDPPSCT